MLHLIRLPICNGSFLCICFKLLLRCYWQAYCCQVLFIFGVWVLSRIFTKAPPHLSSNFTANFFLPQARSDPQGPCFIDVKQSTFCSNFGHSDFPTPHSDPHCNLKVHHGHHLQRKQSGHFLPGPFLDHLPFLLLSLRPQNEQLSRMPARHSRGGNFEYAAPEQGGKACTQASAFPQYAPVLDAVDASQKLSSCRQYCSLMSPGASRKILCDQKGRFPFWHLLIEQALEEKDEQVIPIALQEWSCCWDSRCLC